MEISSLTKKQLEDRLITLHKAGLELVQDISIDSLLEKVATLACQEAEAQFAAVSIVNTENKVEKIIPVGMSAEDVKRIAENPEEKSLIGELYSTRKMVKSVSASPDPNSMLTSFLGIPIQHGDSTLGYIFLGNKINSVEFTNDDCLIIEMLSSYASAAITNARLYKDLIQRDLILTRRNEDLALLDELASTLASSTDIDQILDKVLTQLMDYLGLEASEIYLRQHDSKNLILKMHKGISNKHLCNRTQYVMGEGIVGQTVKSGSPILLDLSKTDCDELVPELKTSGVRQIAVVSLKGRRSGMGALIVAARHPQPLDELEVQFLQAIGSWIATAIENVRLHTQDRKLAILEERERIGMDLHDGIIQSIYAVGLTLEHARLLLKENPAQSQKRIEQAISDLNATIRDIRAYILDLRPRQLHNEDLMSGISRLVAEFRANTLLDVNLQGPNEDISHLPKNQAVSLFHICQEALANIAKHAHAKKVDVVVWTTNDRLLLEIRDDGVGFSTEKSKVSIGHGLSNMETRVLNAGGEVDISSEPGKGTTIFAWVPFGEEESGIVE